MSKHSDVTIEFYQVVDILKDYVEKSLKNEKYADMKKVIDKIKDMVQ